MKFLAGPLRIGERATRHENGGIKFIQAVPISRKSCALKAGIRALTATPVSRSSLASTPSIHLALFSRSVSL